jgi:hypothetical protein
MDTNLSENIEGVLSRHEMKNIIAGNHDCTGNECSNCLICWNDDGSDATEITYILTDEDPDMACRRNGPYSTGSWGQCSDLAIH